MVEWGGAGPVSIEGSAVWNAERVMHYVIYFYAVSFDAVVSFDVVVSFDANGAVHKICFMSFTL